MIPRSRFPAIGALALALAGCSRPASERSVLLVTLDTTRADRIGTYGCPSARTPVLDRLARRGVLFEEAIVDVPVTLPSHTSLLTGVPALAHGVRFNADYRVGPSARTLAERFAGLGYATGAVISALVLDAKFGLDQGFSFYEDDLRPGYVRYDESIYPAPTHWLPKADRRAAETTDLAIAWLEKAPRPFFLWVHYYDPHFPYDPPPPWGRTSGERYLAEIQFTDHELGRLLARLEELDPAGGTIVWVAADHGEGLDQHREDGHGIFLYDETVRVPMLARAPELLPAGRLLSEQVRSIDVAPTLLELAGHPGPFGRGGSLLPAIRRTGPPPDALAYCESIKTKLFYSGTGLKALRTREHKFVWAPAPELYDLRADPGETRNLAPERPDLLADMRARLRDRVGELLESASSFAEAVDLDRDMAEGLRSLGYLSGGGGPSEPGTVAEEMALVGHDPKDLVDVSMGAREIQNGFYANGERKLLRFFRTARRPEEDPRMARLWAAAHQNYAKIWMVRGRYLRAAEEYARALEADARYEAARSSRIYALNLGGRADQAARESARLLERYPRAWKVRLHRGLALALLGRTEEAGAELERVVAGAPPASAAARVARYYRARLGTPDERAALEAYLASEREP